MQKFLSVVVAFGIFATGYGLAAGDAPTGANKNLKILPKDMSKPELKKLMKSVAGALGVQCDFCHNTDDFAADTEKKEIARQMMTMVAEINKSHFNGKPRVGCVTCHNGQKEPKKP